MLYLNSASLKSYYSSEFVFNFLIHSLIEAVSSITWLKGSFLHTFHLNDEEHLMKKANRSVAFPTFPMMILMSFDIAGMSLSCLCYWEETLREITSLRYSFSVVIDNKNPALLRGIHYHCISFMKRINRNWSSTIN